MSDQAVGSQTASSLHADEKSGKVRIPRSAEGPYGPDVMSTRARPFGVAAVAIGLLGLTVAGAQPTAAAPPTPAPAPATPEREWTILYYGMADNDLETLLISDVLEMGSVNFGPDVTVYGLLDRSAWDHPPIRTNSGQVIADDGDIPGLGDFTGTRAFVATGGQIVSMADLGELDMGNPDTLAWFVAEGLRVAPAKRTALIISDHGFGPLGIGPDYTTILGDYTPDDANADYRDELTDLDSRELARALQRGLGGRTLDLLAFDACLMGNLETARFIAPFADYLLAAEDVVPGLGYDYTAFSALAANPQLSPVDLGRALIDGFERFYTAQYPTDNITLALYDLDAIERLERAAQSLATALVDNGAGAAFGAALNASAQQVALDPGGNAFIDLGDLARRLAQPGSPDAVRIAADAVYSATSAAVVHQFRANGRSDATGISITNFPEGAIGAYQSVLAPYWNEWLLRYYGSILPLPVRPEQVWTTTDAEISAGADGIIVTGTLRPEVAASGNVVGATALFGAPVGGDEVEIAIRYPAVVNSGEAGRVAASWGLTSFVLESGGTIVRPTVELEQSSELLVGRVSGTWVWPGQGTAPASLQFTIDPATGQPGAPTLYTQQPSTGAWAETSAAELGTFQPDIQVLSGDGAGITSTPASVLAMDGLTVRLNRQTTGRVAAALGAISSNGAVTAIAATLDLG